MKAGHPCVGAVRSIGLRGCIELVKDRMTKEPFGQYAGMDAQMARLGAFLREQGVYTYIWRNLLHTNPPLCVTEGQLREAFVVVDEALVMMDTLAIGESFDANTSRRSA
jgi:taurine--2-oxoglutarate transaminase